MIVSIIFSSVSFQAGNSGRNQPIRSLREQDLRSFYDAGNRVRPPDKEDLKQKGKNGGEGNEIRT